MKHIFLSLLMGSVLLVISVNASSQEASTHQTADSTIQFNVSGVCEMCKKRIEEAAKGKGVKAALWNMDTKMLSLTFDPKRTTIHKVSGRIVDAGYDTPDLKAKDSDYNRLPACCRYREFSSMEEMLEKEQVVIRDTSASSIILCATITTP